MSEKPLRILYLAAEVEPFAKTGGLAEVAGALPQALRQRGHDLRVSMPRYGHVDPASWNLKPALPSYTVAHGRGQEEAQVFAGHLPASDVPIWLIDNPKFFGSPEIYLGDQDAERFIFWARASLEAARLLDWVPDIIHSNDWHAAIVPNWLRTTHRRQQFFRSTATVYTIHTLAYRGVFGQRVLETAGVDAFGFITHPDLPSLNRVVDLMSRGIYYANIINTVSPTHAQEILTPAFGEGLDPLLRDRRDRLYGILNGVDYSRYNPATDTTIAAPYAADDLSGKLQNKAALQTLARLPVDPDIPVYCFIGRLNDQKGLALLQEALELLAGHHAMQIIILGTGDERYHHWLHWLREQHPEQVQVFFTFNEQLARQCYAGSDVLLMPSLVEPCGTNQLIALRYGTLPLVHAVGGLNDTVEDIDVYQQRGTGFVFHEPQTQALFGTFLRTFQLYRQPALWQAAMRRAMLQDWSWQRSAQLYDDLYRRALASVTARRPRARYRPVNASIKE